ncbi:ATP-NAD kinase family protein [Methanofollis fontis]|uniref:ATP-NAD kinase n=1 Tax=Methanofollis fontis TaxID=2052832 RepID=A0A483CVP5_9EURY|nr:NAD(+)/NADH kinase [Methanofollis fontis]TAJ45587.1 ATP-NAD kinase [Methanofollis fontis]
MRTIGVVINPLAGLGGRVGLKGTDGLADEARRRGAVPLAQERALEALEPLRALDLRVLTSGGEMGASALEEAGIGHEVVYTPAEDATTAADTVAAVEAFVRRGAEVILFCGGDGTARDVVRAAGDTPILGIPAGVKMFSGVFVSRPEGVAAVLVGPLDSCEAEVMDIDEEAYRRGELRARLFAAARVPCRPCGLQGCKAADFGDEREALAGLARFMADLVLSGGTTLLGAGGTTAAIAAELGLEKTLLGVDVIRDGRIVAADADERTLLQEVRGGGRCRIIVSPIGAQGAVLGRGTQQISPDVVRAVGAANVIVVATPQKLAATPALFVDTGDPGLDAAFGREVQVICGYHAARRMPLSR